jgi:hypothetical protein
MTLRLRLAFRWAAVFLALPLTTAAFEAPPDPAEQDRLLAAMHQYADHYISSLPNFICTQV